MKTQFMWLRKKGQRTENCTKQKEKGHDDDCVTTATSDDFVILHDFDSLNLVRI